MNPNDQFSSPEDVERQVEFDRNRDRRDRRDATSDRRQEPRRVEDKAAEQARSLPVDESALLAELRGLASTVRAAMRNGHPDATKHLNTLLTRLGAV